MKTIQRLTILAGLSMVFFALSATGAKAQIFSPNTFSATFTLPATAQWGNVTLPAGTYNLYYGSPSDGGARMVEVVGKAKGSPSGMIQVQGRDFTSAAKSALVCIRDGSTLIVRALEIPELGTVAQFAMPHGTQIVAQNANRKGYLQLAEAPMLIQRIPVTLNAK